MIGYRRDDTILLFFFFQAEDGIRDLTVTGVQTCALPIFGMKIDHRKISVAQTADVRPIEQLQEEAVRSRANKRVVVFQGLEVRPSERPQRGLGRVRLAFEGREAPGGGQGAPPSRKPRGGAPRATAP